MVYEAKCTECDEPNECGKEKNKMLYIGETARQVGTRVGEHLNNANLLKLNSFIVEHWMETHPLMTSLPKFVFKVRSKHQDPLTRQIREAVNIRHEGKLNRKNEFSINELIKLETSKYSWEEVEQRREEQKTEDLHQLHLKDFVNVMYNICLLRQTIRVSVNNCMSKLCCMVCRPSLKVAPPVAPPS